MLTLLLKLSNLVCARGVWRTSWIHGAGGGGNIVLLHECGLAGAILLPLTLVSGAGLDTRLARRKVSISPKSSPEKPVYTTTSGSDIDTYETYRCDFTKSLNDNTAM